MGIVGLDRTGEAEQEGFCLADVIGLENGGVEVHDLVEEDGGDVDLMADQLLVLGDVEIPEEENAVLEGDPLRGEVAIVLVQLFFVIGKLEVHVAGQDILFSGRGQVVEIDGFVDGDQGGLEDLFVDGDKAGNIGEFGGGGYFEGEGVTLAGVSDEGFLLAGEQAGLGVVGGRRLREGA